MLQSHEEQPEVQMIKITLISSSGNSDSVWAEQISKDTAILWNIPCMAYQWGYGDFVRFNQNRVAVERLLAQTETEIIAYNTDGSKAEVEQRYQSIAKYFQSCGVEIELAITGYATVARPREMTRITFRRLCDDAPTTCEWEEP